MKAVRADLNIEFLADMATHNGFLIKNEDHYSPTNVDAWVDSSKFTDVEYRCECGAFTGQDFIGQTCPRCKTEISLHSLNFAYTGWMSLHGHHVISPVYYIMLKRVLGTPLLRYILGDYKSKLSVKYNENDKGNDEELKSNFEERSKVRQILIWEGETNNWVQALQDSYEKYLIEDGMKPKKARDEAKDVAKKQKALQTLKP